MGNEVAVSWFYNVPALNIAMPASADEAYWCFRDALQRPAPTLFFEDRSIHNRAGEIAATDAGARARVTRAGNRLTIIAAGRTAVLAEDVVDQMAKEGNREAIEMVSLGFIKPLDRETLLNAASKTGRVLIVQDEPPWSGYGPYVRCLLDELPRDALAVRPRLLSGADEFLPYWDERPFLPSLESVLAAVKEMLK
jgi:pyruvate dehydrogenase E1 component beta subunit